jgi:diphthine synthase
MLHLIGVGLSDPDDITVKGLEKVKSADKVYLEGYTSKLNTTQDELESLYEQSITVAPRRQLEQDHDDILDEAENNEVVVLVIGDVFSATTHSMLFVEARERGISVDIVHNASIITAVSQTGLQLYKFGKTTSIVYPDGDWLPATPYEAIRDNRDKGLHTLCLLDIKADSAGLDGDDDTFMTAQEAVNILYELERREASNVITDDTPLIVVQDLTGPDQKIWTGELGSIEAFDGDQPLHSLILPADLHDMEQTMLEHVS